MTGNRQFSDKETRILESAEALLGDERALDMRAAREGEREACARLIEGQPVCGGVGGLSYSQRAKLARLIRSRSTL